MVEVLSTKFARSKGSPGNPVEGSTLKQPDGTVISTVSDPAIDKTINTSQLPGGYPANYKKVGVDSL